MELSSLPAIYLGPNYGGGNENFDLPQKIPGMYCYSPCPPTLQQATTDPRLRWRPWTPPRQVSCEVTVPFSWVLVHKVLLCHPRVYFPVLCKFWQLYSGFNSDLLQKDLCHTHTQNPCPCADHCRPVPLQEMLKHSYVSVSVGVPGSWCAQNLFEPSEHLWRERGLILNANLPSYHRVGASPLSLDVRYFLIAASVPTVLLGFF